MNTYTLRKENQFSLDPWFAVGKEGIFQISQGHMNCARCPFEGWFMVINSERVSGVPIPSMMAQMGTFHHLSPAFGGSPPSLYSVGISFLGGLSFMQALLVLSSCFNMRPQAGILFLCPVKQENLGRWDLIFFPWVATSYTCSISSLFECDLGPLDISLTFVVVVVSTVVLHLY